MRRITPDMQWILPDPLRKNQEEEPRRSLLTIPNAALELDIGETQLRTAVSRGKIPIMKLGNRMLVDVDMAREVFKDEKAGVKIKEASERTGLSVSAIRRGMRDGWIPYTKPLNCYIFNMDEVYAAIDKRIEESRALVLEGLRKKF